jgi:hypothetical protein
MGFDSPQKTADYHMVTPDIEASALIVHVIDVASRSGKVIVTTALG